MEILYVLALLIIQLYFLAYSNDFTFTKIINGGDTLQILNPLLFIERSFSVWLDSETGIPFAYKSDRNQD